MKTNNSIHRSKRHFSTIVGSILLAVIVIIGLSFAVGKLRAIYLEQCVLTDFDRQITIHTGDVVKKEVIAEMMGLKPNVNLATIDYATRRAETLKAIPNLRNLRIRRHLPDRLSIYAEERTPVARLTLKRQSKHFGYVVDSDGIAFRCYKKTQLLPIIREAGSVLTTPGMRVPDAARAAIILLDAFREPEFQQFGVLEIDATCPDFLLVTINTGVNYSQLQIAWEGMYERPTPASHAALLRQLTKFKQALASIADAPSMLWNATEPGRVYAKPKGMF